MVNFSESDGTRPGLDARIEPEDSVVQSVLAAVQAASVDDISGSSTGGQSTGAMPPPLYEFINPDALEALYSHARDRNETVDWTTTFRYADADVSVTSAGTVTVEPADVEGPTNRAHRCPSCEDGGVDLDDDEYLVGATLQCPECGHEWDVSF